MYVLPVAQTVKNLPTMQVTQVRSLDWEDPLEKGTAIHSSTLAWRILRTKKPGRLQSMGLQSPTQLRDEHYTICIYPSFDLIFSSEYFYSISENESHSFISNSLRPTNYTVHGILQAIILDWVTVPFFMGSSQP